MILFYIQYMITKYTRSELQTFSKRKLIDIIIQLQDSFQQLEERLQKLEGQLHQDSHNSHIPPSRSKPLLIKNLREPTGKSPGGQPGHPGHTLEMVDNPTGTITCRVTRCKQCGRDLSNIPVTSYEKRQVFDIPPLQLEVIEYRVEQKLCSCGQINTASFPPSAQAPVQYGINTQTLVNTLATHGYMSQERISETMEYLTGYRMSEATICSIQSQLYTNLADFEERSKQHLTESRVIHNDETGISVTGKREWVHVSSTAEVTHYAIDPKRGKEAMDRIGILPHFQGRSIHDRWRPYFRYKECQHGCCNAHHLREATFFEEEEKASWARPLKDLLLEAKTTVEEAQRKGHGHLDQEILQQYSQRYNTILEGALKNLPPPVRTGKRGRLKKTKQRNFIESLLEYKESVLAFISDFRVPFSNNLAERDLRMFKVKDKVSGTFRSRHGAECFARIRGYISTVRKNDRNVYEEIKNALLEKPFLLQKWRIANQFLKYDAISNPNIEETPLLALV
jgi:transposase